MTFESTCFLNLLPAPPRRLGMTHYDAIQKQRAAIHDTAMGSASLKPQLCLGTTNAGLAAASNYYFSLVVCVRVRSCLCACGGERACLCARPRVCAYVCVWAFVSGCACAPLCTWVILVRLYQICFQWRRETFPLPPLGWVAEEESLVSSYRIFSSDCFCHPFMLCAIDL